MIIGKMNFKCICCKCGNETEPISRGELVPKCEIKCEKCGKSFVELNVKMA